MKTKRCGDCGTELPHGAKACPVCARNFVWERRAVLLVGMGATVCVLAVLALIALMRML
jgi:hypothetical protein